MRENIARDLLRVSLSEEEEMDKIRILSLLNTEPRCFFRDVMNPGHITGSAMLVSENGERILLNHHAIFKCWMNFGGHADGEEDIESVARRELIEESGISNLTLVGDSFFDVGVHPVAENPVKKEGPHAHFDIRFLYKTPETEFVISHESLGIKWFSIEEALALPLGHTTRRMILKIKEQV